MEITADISLYPFDRRFREQVEEFVSGIQEKYPGLLMDVNAMSTQIAGPYDEVMEMIRVEIREFFISNNAAFVLKIAKGCRVE